MLGRLLPQPLHPSGETESVCSEHTGMACQVREQAQHPKAKGWRRLWECPAALQGVGRSQVDKVSVDRWLLFCSHAQSRQLKCRKCRYQSLALPRCPRHQTGLVKGGEGPPVMGAWPAWPGDSVRAGIWLVLALLQAPHPDIAKSKAGILLPPRSSLGRPYVT